MVWNTESLQLLSKWFFDTLNPVLEPRVTAERSLSEASNQPNYALAILHLIAEPSIDEHIRHSAAVNFKNHLRSRWLPAKDSCISPILDSEKEQIKKYIVSLMLSSSPRIQSQLSEALAVIGKHDFPRSWPSLLPELDDNLTKAGDAGDYASVNGILGTANTIFKTFRHQFRTNDLFTDIKYCLENFANPLQKIFLKTAALIDSAASSGGSAAMLKPLFESQKLCCRIFFSLNSQDLPEFFEDNMDVWMGEFKKYLSLDYGDLENTGDGLALVDDLRGAVCENINLYMEIYEEEFGKHVYDFASAVWKLLEVVSKSYGRDQLATKAIKFLTIVSSSSHHTLFAGDNVIENICKSIVIPNVTLKDEDEELFEMNYIEFIRRDMEGDDVDTRRRIACELLKGLAVNYKLQVTKAVSNEIQKLLISSVAQWKDKDCAIYLVVSLAIKKAGGGSVTTDLIDVKSLYENIIIPELQSQDVNSFPMLKAGSLKFVTMFSSLLPKPFAIQLFPNLVRFLEAESNVVHSYAAICIEKLLLVKEEGGKSRYVANDISPFLLELMKNLFAALGFPDSEENHYLMKCIMRVLSVAEINGEVAVPCIRSLTSVLDKVCQNPKNPVFNHYLFESVALLIRRGCDRDISLISTFESDLFPILSKILVNDITEFSHYAFQLLAQLVELNRPPLSANYMQIFSVLLSPELWKRSGNVPALVHLLQAYLQKAPQEVTQDNRLSQVLEIFEMLISSPSTDEQGFYVLNTIIEYLDQSVIDTYMKGVWSALFTRLGKLQNEKTDKFKKSLVVFMSLFVVKHGPAYLVDTMKTVQLDIFTAILEHVWIPTLKEIMGTIEVKLTAVAATRLICATPALLDVNLWGKMLDSTVTLLSRPEEERVVVDEAEMLDITGNVGYTGAFVKLHNAGKKEEDPLKHIIDPKQFLLESLASLSLAFPGTYPQIIGEHVNKATQTALCQLCNAYNCRIA